MYHQGDVVLVSFPYTDLSQTKLRPAVIVSLDACNENGDFICVQVTSRVLERPLLFELQPAMVIPALPLPSTIRLNKLFCLNEKLIVHKVAQMESKALRELIRLLVDSVFLQPE